ncbi:MAG: hypothetical protein ABSE73_06230 [Planctomycetota bacterium]
MKGVKFLLPLSLALLCSFALAADADSPKKGDSTFGTLSEAPAGGDAKVIAVLKVKGHDQNKSLNVIATGDELIAQIKDLAKKGAKVKAKGDVSADGASITVTKIDEAKGHDKKGHGDQ